MSSPVPGVVPYFASKKAVTTISEGLRIELGLTKSKIKVSVSINLKILPLKLTIFLYLVEVFYCLRAYQ